MLLLWIWMPLCLKHTLILKFAWSPCYIFLWWVYCVLPYLFWFIFIWSLLWHVLKWLCHLASYVCFHETFFHPFTLMLYLSLMLSCVSWIQWKDGSYFYIHSVFLYHFIGDRDHWCRYLSMSWVSKFLLFHCSCGGGGAYVCICVCMYVYLILISWFEITYFLDVVNLFRL